MNSRCVCAAAYVYIYDFSLQYVTISGVSSTTSQVVSRSLALACSLPSSLFFPPSLVRFLLFCFLYLLTIIVQLWNKEKIWNHNHIHDKNALLRYAQPLLLSPGHFLCPFLSIYSPRALSLCAYVRNMSLPLLLYAVPLFPPPLSVIVLSPPPVSVFPVPPLPAS